MEWLRLCSFYKHTMPMHTTKTMAIAIIAAFLSLSAAAQPKEGLQQPAAPDSLDTNATHAEYLARHYWDNYNFNDTTAITDNKATAQAFADFIAIMPHVAPATAADALRIFVNRISHAPATSREAFAELADSCLGDDNSPLHNDMLYAQYLDLMGSSKFATIAERTRNEYMAHNLRKNLPGTVAADFNYTMHDGTRHSMHQFSATYTLLFFYDPDCQHCRDTAAQLANMQAINGKQATGKIKVLAIYPYDETERWMETTPPFPSVWTDGCSPGGELSALDTYYFKSMPSIYLLDADKRVILKNPSTSVLQKAIDKLAQ